MLLKKCRVIVDREFNPIKFKRTIRTISTPILQYSNCKIHRLDRNITLVCRYWYYNQSCPLDFFNYTYVIKENKSV